MLKQVYLPPSPGPTAKIPLSHNLYAIVDSEDYAYLSRFHWSARKSHSCWYAVRKFTINGKRRTVFMHRCIFHPPPCFDVHHKNHNTLDNRRENLETLTPVEHHLQHLLDSITRKIEQKTGGTPQTHVLHE